MEDNTFDLVGVINEDKVIQCVTTEITVEDITVIVATNNIYQGVAVMKYKIVS